jgi:hypothetical protein
MLTQTRAVKGVVLEVLPWPWSTQLGDGYCTFAFYIVINLCAFHVLLVAKSCSDAFFFRLTESSGYQEDGGDTFPRNVGNRLLDYTASQPRRPQSLGQWFYILFCCDIKCSLTGPPDYKAEPFIHFTTLIFSRNSFVYLALSVFSPHQVARRVFIVRKMMCPPLCRFLATI